MSAPTAQVVTAHPEDVLRRVKEFIAANFYVTEPELLGPDAPLVEDGIIDSTGMLELIAFLESEFGLAIRDEEMLPENLGSIRRIGAFVARKRAEGP